MADKRRRPLRLPYYDYSQVGIYFVTICTHDRDCLFGAVVDGLMQINAYGQVVETEWLRTSSVRPEVTLDAFVVMPNHFHGILVLGGTRGATHRVAPTNRSTGLAPGSLGSIVGQFKSLATRNINALRGTPGAAAWQRGYYEPIVRNDEDLDRIRRYIADNPARWAEDVENPAGTQRNQQRK